MGGVRGPVAAGSDAGAHEGHAPFFHDRAHVGKIHVDKAGHHNEVGNPPHRKAQHFIGHAKDVLDAGVLGAQGEEAVVGDGDDGVHHLAQLLDAVVGQAPLHLAFEFEGLAHHGHGQGAQFPAEFGHHRGAAGTGAAAHAGGDEHHVGPLEDLLKVLGFFHGGFAAHFGIAPGPQTPGHIGTQLDLHRGQAPLQGLGIGVGGDEIDAHHLGGNHIINGVAAGAADP